ncbi:N-acetylmuramoyl-L-alanine amidase [Thioclava sp. SK-1]|uniref:N-acetylmuramoyl-L-alanine amidase n=1 Tax=Thioclava sp. SK-1 TaxID=1889770 RepID=UPI00082476FA|nr:N-acetylmuramoyl-L-alanine amidase [Thioclava sp. SK-1]OCX66697.1 N-acetylmuramoyl-L-alanine amidase [Thioclava sp. SK-1]
MAYPSPNFTVRRNGLTPTLIVLHYTAMRSFQDAYDRLCDPQAEVSAHWLIGADGSSHPLVDEAARAWHAGVGAWRGQNDINSRSIGIELDNRGTHPFPAAQMTALEQLLRALMARWNIRPDQIIGHSDMAPDRKSDPGPRFDWARLARQGLSIQPRITRYCGPSDAAHFYTLARRFGYPDATAADLLTAMRLRFRQGHDGPLDRCDMAIITDLATRYGSDHPGDL